MNEQDVKQKLETMSMEIDGDGRRAWRDSRHVLIKQSRLSNALSVPGLDAGCIIAVEIELNDPEPVLEYDSDGAIRKIDGAGIWCHDGDGSIEDMLWRSILIPWHRVRRITAHQAS
jgi:hypothetical protein